MMENAEAIWAAKSDDELLEASGELFEYTESGEQIIRAELRRRGLAEPDPPIGKCSRCGRSIPSNHPGDRCSECEESFPPDILQKLGADTPDPVLVPVLRTEDPGLVPLAKSILDEEGIEHLVRGEDLQDPFGGRTGYGGGPVEFCVREEDAERARTLLDGAARANGETSIRSEPEAKRNLVSIAPFFIVDDLQASIAHYIERFGFTLNFQGPPDGAYYAQVGRDGIGIMLKSVVPDVHPCPNHTRHEWARWDAYIYTRDPDTLYDEFKRRGATFVKGLSFIDEGLWGFEVTDRDGYVLAFFRTRNE